MKKATISADIIASSSLTYSEMQNLSTQINNLFEWLNNKYNTKRKPFYARLIKGDYIECYMKNPKIALEVALMLKAFVKTFATKQKTAGRRDTPHYHLFRNYGIRVAIGIGEMEPPEGVNSLWTGDAITFSGRKIDEQKTANKSKAIVKNTLFFDTDNEKTAFLFSCFLGLLDKILNSATNKQSEVLFWKLYGLTEMEIAQKLNISQSAVNQHSTSVGWNAIENTVHFFKQYRF